MLFLSPFHQETVFPITVTIGLYAAPTMNILTAPIVIKTEKSAIAVSTDPGEEDAKYLICLL